MVCLPPNSQRICFGFFFLCGQIASLVSIVIGVSIPVLSLLTVPSSSPKSPSPLKSPPRPAAMSAPAPSSSDVLKKAVPHVDIDGHNLPPSPAPSSPRTGRKYAIATELVYTESNDQYNASSVPIYQVSHGGSRPRSSLGLN